MRYDEKDFQILKKVLMNNKISTSNSKDSITREFEHKFSKMLNINYALGISSGTAGLHIALLSCGTKAGDEVLVDPLFQFGTLATLYCNAIPVFYDVDIDTYMPTIDMIKEKVTERTKAIIVTNIFGCTPNLEKIRKICDDNHIFLIEDCAHSLLCEYNGKMAGTYGHFGVFSFQSSKHLSLGDGGMIVTNDYTLHRNALLLHSHGTSSNIPDINGANLNLGWMYRISELVSAVGISQLDKISIIIDYHKYVGNYLNSILNSHEIIKQKSLYSNHVYWRWVARIKNPKLYEILEEKFVGNNLIKFGLNRKTTVNDSLLLKKLKDKNTFNCPYDCIFAADNNKKNIELSNANRLVKESFYIKISYEISLFEYEKIAFKINETVKEFNKNS